MLPDVPVHGVNFHALERLPLDEERRETLRRTAWRLAEFVRSQPPSFEDAKNRFRRKIISLCLRTWLRECTLHYLIALQGDDILDTDARYPRRSTTTLAVRMI